MFSGNFALAVTMGMVATVNPCGFAMLPAYLSAFVGLEPGMSRLGAVGRALAVSLALTAGFVTVFGLLGIVFGSAVNEVLERAPWLTIVLGLLLAALGIYLLAGRTISLSIPKLQRGGADGGLVSMYLYGVSYAVVSLSCSIGTFAGVTSSASNDGNFVSRLLTFVLYGVGMGLVIAVLTLAVALAREGVVARFRAALPYVNRVAGGLMVLAGTYVAYYGWYELRIRDADNLGDDAVIDRASRLQRRLEALMPHVGNYGWYVAGALLLIAAACVWQLRANRRPA